MGYSESDFEEIDDTLHEASMGGAEAHGFLSGLLCANDGVQLKDWLAGLFDEEDSSSLVRIEKIALERLFETTRQLITSDDYDFELFLPDEDEPLSVRATALSEWCRGFVYGLGFGGMDKEAEWQGDSREILQDLVEISRLDSECGGEDDESAFMELNEYVRMGVLLIHRELRGNGQTEADAEILH